MDSAQPSIEDIDEVTKTVQATIPSDEYVGLFDSRIKRLMLSAKIKGFRPGKVPRHLIEKLYGKTLESEVISELVSNHLTSTVEQHGLELVGIPDVQIDPLQDSKAVRYTAKLSVQPRPAISGYDSFSVEATKREVEEADIVRVLDALCERKATFEPLPFRDVARLGDVADLQVRVEYEGRESSPAEPATVELGKGVLPLDVEQGLEGLKVGQKRTLEVQVPDDHQEADLRGTTAVYHVELSRLLEKRVPQLDDAVAATLYPGAQSVLDLRIKVRDDLERTAERDARDDVVSKVFEALVEKNRFAVPQAMIDDEIRAVLVDQGAVDPSKINVQRLPVDRFRGVLGDLAERRVRLRTIVDQIARQEQISVNESEIATRIGEIAERLGISIDQVHRVYETEENRAQLRADLVRDKVLALLRGRTTITYVPKPKDESEVAAA